MTRCHRDRSDRNESYPISTASQSDSLKDHVTPACRRHTIRPSNVMEQSGRLNRRAENLESDGQRYRVSQLTMPSTTLISSSAFLREACPNKSPAAALPCQVLWVAYLPCSAAAVLVICYYATNQLTPVSDRPMRLEDTENTVQYFARTNMFTLLEMQRKEADRAINDVNPDALLNTPTDDLVRKIVDTYKLDVPVLLRADAHMDEPREITISKQDYGRTIHVQGTILVLHVPFTGDAGMFWIQPTSYNPRRPAVI